jgi:hypothetical protein
MFMTTLLFALIETPIAKTPLSEATPIWQMLPMAAALGLLAKYKWAALKNYFSFRKVGVGTMLFRIFLMSLLFGLILGVSSISVTVGLGAAAIFFIISIIVYIVMAISGGLD